MITTHSTFNEFFQAFHDYGRGSSFSPSALDFLYYFYCDNSVECIELCPINISYHWNEYTLEQVMHEYGAFIDSVNENDHQEVLFELDLLALDVTFLEASKTFLIRN
jgi:hypothetical protein